MSTEKRDLDDLDAPRPSLRPSLPGDLDTPYKGCPGVQVSPVPMVDTANSPSRSPVVDGQPAAPRASAFTRWAILVHRADGQVEILSTLHFTQAEAEVQAAYWRDHARGVKVQAVRCTIRVDAPRVSLVTRARRLCRFPP